MPVQIIKGSKKPTKKVTKKIPVGQTTKQKKGEQEISAEHKVAGEVVIEEPMCNVGLTLGGTRNLGDYQNFKFTISLHKPCKPEDIDDTYEEVKSWVDMKAEEIMLEAMEDED